MNKKEKIQLLDKAMEVKKREDGTEFTCFSDNAPEELKDLFLEHYEVRNQDYEIFSNACDVFGNYTLKNIEYYEIDTNFASPYNADRLSYLNVWNDSEIAEISKNYSCETISLACAIWYDEQVQSAIRIINEWVNKE